MVVGITPEEASKRVDQFVVCILLPYLSKYEIFCKKSLVKYQFIIISCYVFLNQNITSTYSKCIYVSKHLQGKVKS